MAREGEVGPGANALGTLKTALGSKATQRNPVCSRIPGSALFCDGWRLGVKPWSWKKVLAIVFGAPRKLQSPCDWVLHPKAAPVGVGRSYFLLCPSHEGLVSW